MLNQLINYPMYKIYLITFWVSTKLQVNSGDPVVIILATGSEVGGLNPDRVRWIFSKRKNLEYDFLRKGSKAVLDLRHVKQLQASVQNLSDFSRSL